MRRTYMHAQEVKTVCMEALLAAGISPKHCQVCEVHAATFVKLVGSALGNRK